MISKSDIQRKVQVTLTWPELYFESDPATGEKRPVKFNFTFKRQKRSERDALINAAFVQDKSTEDRRLDLFCSLISQAPEGFSDFPTDETRELSDRAREYFSGEDMGDFVYYALTAYDATVTPSELLFRV